MIRRIVSATTLLALLSTHTMAECQNMYKSIAQGLQSEINAPTNYKYIDQNGDTLPGQGINGFDITIAVTSGAAIAGGVIAFVAGVLINGAGNQISIYAVTDADKQRAQNLQNNGSLTMGIAVGAMALGGLGMWYVGEKRVPVSKEQNDYDHRKNLQRALNKLNRVVSLLPQNESDVYHIDNFVEDVKELNPYLSEARIRSKFERFMNGEACTDRSGELYDYTGIARLIATPEIH